jgi:hypothetical protein
MLSRILEWSFDWVLSLVGGFEVKWKVLFKFFKVGKLKKGFKIYK